MLRRNFLNASGAGVTAAVLAACGGGGEALMGAGGSDSSSELQKDSRSTRPSTTTTTATATNYKSRVIVIGGGMGGATVAKYLRLWGDAIGVTLIERMPTYTSNIMSSLVLTGQRSLSSITYNYDTLRSKYGIKTVFGDVVSIDPAAAKVTLSNGDIYEADRIVMAPGIDFDTVEGLGDSDKMPHAWKAGSQTTLLAKQLSAMRSGNVVLTIPKVPYRCPPGPYERACLIADWLKVKKPGSKLFVLDANDKIVVEKENFESAFKDLYGNVVEYVPNAEVVSVDPSKMLLNTAAGQFTGAVINMIPRQKAGSLITTAGLNNSPDGRFAGVNVLSYASTVSGAEKVHIIGDSSATTQPKAGHIANQEAKVCADAISRILSGGSPDPAPVTNSACFSTITMTQASWLSAGYQFDATSATMKVVPAAFGASAGWSKDNFDEMGTWFKSLMSDSFA